MHRLDYRGIYVIAVTPFTDTLDLDEEGLRRTIRFCIDAGVHGIVSTANAGEVGYMSDEERRRAAEIVVEEASGKAATVVGVSTSCARLSACFARHAEAIGADAVMAMPPTFHPAPAGEIRAFYRELAAATALPIVIQNMSGPGGTVMGAQLMADIVAEVPAARFIKEETDFAAMLIGEVLALCGDRLGGVMGGKAGKTLMDEIRRGACGTMPACEIADVHVALWNAIEAGDTAKARDIFRRLLPLLDFEMIYGVPVCKEVLRRRGVIRSSGYRQTGRRALDAKAQDELSAILADLAPLMLPAYPAAA